MGTSLRDSRDQLALSGDATATGVGRPTRLRQVRGTLYRVGLPVFGVVATITVWQWATWFFEIRTFFLPSPYQIADWLWRNAELLVAQGWVTVYETLAGFAIGALAGLVAAVALVASPTLERATLPLVISLNAIPKVALAPVLVAWLGLGREPKIALAASICFFPIMIATMAGLASTPSELGELARSLTASRWQSFVKVRVPWALPQVFVGLKLGMTLAVIGAVVAEMMRPSGGLGTVIFLAGQNANTTQTFAAIVALMVISITLFYAVVLVERWLLPWARETSAART
jgi:NitT/TauT family transport system permease protein